MLNTYFARTLSAKNPMQLQTTDECVQQPIFSLKNVSCEQVFNALMQTDRAAVAVQDDLSGQVLRELAPSVSNNICSIFNKSIDQGSFPSMWKKVNNTAIWKGKGSKEDP